MIDRHCSNCFNQFCMISECPVIQCKNNCGFAFHACKQLDHNLICSFEKVSCINHHYGCPLKMRRDRMSAHLKCCPASVVFCTMSWSRWRVADRQCTSPTVSKLTKARYEQLDVALAMRDQRMILRKFQDSTQNDQLLLPTPAQQGDNGAKYGAVLPETTTQLRLEDGDGEFFIGEGSPPPGLSSSVRSRLSSSSSYHNGNNHASALTVISDMDGDDIEVSGCDAHAEDTAADTISSGDTSAACTSCETDDRIPPNDNPVTARAPSVVMLKRESDLILKDILSLDIQLEQKVVFFNNPQMVHLFWCAQHFRRDEYSWHCKNVHSEIQGELSGWLEIRCPLAYAGCTYSVHRLQPHRSLPAATLCHSSLLESFGVQCQPDRSHSNRATTVYDDDGGGGGELSEGSEASLFRKEATPEIMASYNHRSALLVKTRFRDASLNEISEVDEQSVHLTDLPQEIIQYLLRFLDGFSLNSMALTCRSLRETCSNLLTERGIVIQKWDKVSSSPARWQVTEKKWLFSTAFSPVTSWRFCDNEHMANHLSECKYNKRVEHNPNVSLFGIGTPPFKRKRYKSAGGGSSM